RQGATIWTGIALANLTMLWLLARIRPLTIMSSRCGLASLATVSVISASSLSGWTKTLLVVSWPLARRTAVTVTPNRAFSLRWILIVIGVSVPALTSSTLPSGTLDESVYAVPGTMARKSCFVGRMWV